MKKHIRWTTAAGLAGLALAATGCAPAAADGAPASDQGTVVTDPGSTTGRVAVSYENGIAVLDPTTLEVVAELDSETFTRLNDFGDGRTIAVTTSKGFQMLDTAQPELTDLVFDATTPGHVVVHDGRTVLFDDGTGRTTILDTEIFADGYASLPEGETYTAAAPHHGVSIVLSDGTLLTTVGDDTGRTGAMALAGKDGGWEQISVNAECPGIHGEGTAMGEAVVFGCEDGALLYRDGSFRKLSAPDPYGRMGNAFVSETSPIVVGDYKSDPDAEGYLLNAVTLIDTAAGTSRVVDLPDEVQYTFRDVARGPEDQAYILSTDGKIHVLDPETGEITDAYPVIDPWQGPAQWQDAHPAIRVRGDIAYVTEPAANTVHAVDLTTGKKVASVELDHTPNELAVANG
ncbi:hypothetical protein G3H63_09500 [Microbacterium resistens]|uniref:zinc metallochaperone AztD n=1 Tax=Microbacterium resistens TaxID=156977 RepID=UPI001C585F52|nr:zinc metallochaperone AztD [Microbacterium resistens]MBW1639304.1 hypothetical protein [Microbacterium resistens]